MELDIGDTHWNVPEIIEIILSRQVTGLNV